MTNIVIMNETLGKNPTKMIKNRKKKNNLIKQTKPMQTERIDEKNVAEHNAEE